MNEIDFDNHVIKILQSKKNNIPQGQSIFKKTALHTSIYFLIFSSCLYFYAPLLPPNFIAENSPSPNRSMEGYINARAINDNTNYTALNRIRNKWPEKSAEITIDKANNHWGSVCLSTVNALREFANPMYLEAYEKLAESSEPEVSEASFEIYNKFQPKFNKGFALKLFNNKNIDIKERVIDYANQEELDLEFVFEVINKVDKTFDDII